MVLPKRSLFGKQPWNSKKKIILIGSITSTVLLTVFVTALCIVLVKNRKKTSRGNRSSSAVSSTNSLNSSRNFITSSSNHSSSYAQSSTSTSTPSNPSLLTTYPLIPVIPQSQNRKLNQLSRALSDVRNGIADAYFCDIGDSLKVGYKAAGPTSEYNGVRAFSYPKLLADCLRSKGFNVNDDALIGDKNLGEPGNQFTNYGLYDPRVNVTSDWDLIQTYENTHVGGNRFKGTGSSSFNYTPSNAFDAFDIVFVTTPNSAPADVLVNGVVKEFNIVLNAPDGFLRKRYSLPVPGKFTISIRRAASVSSGSVAFQAIFPTNTSVRQIHIHTYATIFMNSTSWRDGMFGLANFLDTVQVNYSLLLLGITLDDIVTETPLVNFKTNLVVMISQLRAGGVGDVILQPTPWIAGSSSQQGYLNQVYVLARSDRDPYDAYPIVEAYLMAGEDFVAAEMNGFMSDTGHWSGKGYKLLAYSTFLTILNCSV